MPMQSSETWKATSKDGKANYYLVTFQNSSVVSYPIVRGQGLSIGFIKASRIKPHIVVSVGIDPPD